MKISILLLLAFTVGRYCLLAQTGTTPQLVSSSKADTWAYTDDLGRTSDLPLNNGIKKDRYVGMFYFIWQGAHGYDTNKRPQPGEGVMEKQPGDTMSPYDNSKLIKENPADPAYGPDRAWHYWGEPYFGYYLPNDEWIIRKHAQMLSDAGVDVLIFDVTNASIYLPQVQAIGKVYRAMRSQGLSTPNFAFIVNSNPVKTVDRLYNEFYKEDLYSDLWFNWKGKPLLLCPPEAVTPAIDSFFTIRQSWAWSKGQKWFADGKDKWTWVDHTPQAYGWHESPDKPEQISVASAEHPVSNIGRSFHDGHQPSPDSIETEKGLYFKEQWERALAVDPEFVFVTGWNEWIAMRFTDGRAKNFLGKPIEKGQSFFVDQYNAEFSRDLEPENGTLKDNYYYQLVNYIRQYKGARPVPVSSGNNTIAIDGRFNEWATVKPSYQDDKGDVTHRNHPGWGRIKAYTNSSGRNDIVQSKVASDKDNLFFYVQTSEKLTPSMDPNWMVLYVSNGNNGQANWAGFQYRINQKRSGKKAIVERSTGGWNWQKVGEAYIAVGAKEIEIQVPKQWLGITSNSYTLQFKWADNSVPDGNPMRFMDKGDTAPNSRFTFEYRHVNNNGAGGN